MPTKFTLLFALLVVVAVVAVGPADPPSTADIDRLAKADRSTDRRVRQFVNGEAGERLMEMRASSQGSAH